MSINNQTKILLETVNIAKENEEFRLKTYLMRNDLKLGLAVIFNNFEFDESKCKL